MPEHDNIDYGDIKLYNKNMEYSWNPHLAAFAREFQARGQCEVLVRRLSDEHDDAAFDDALRLASLAAVSEDPEWAKRGDVPVKRHTLLAKYCPGAYVLDPDGPYLVKRYQNRYEALTQAATLNLLHDVLGERDSWVSTARVLAVVSSKDRKLPPAAVLERAPGESLWNMHVPPVVSYGAGDAWRRELRGQVAEVRRELDRCLGWVVSRCLVNDIMLSGNTGANVFVYGDSGERRATLIDQPCPVVRPALARAALLGLTLKHEGMTGLLDNPQRVR